MDKAIEIIKAAMEKEKVMKDKAEETKDIQIDEEMTKETINDEMFQEEMIEEGDDAETIEASVEETNDEKPGKHGKSFFKNSKTKELNAKDQKIDELTDRLMRTMAEFDNFRKRSEKEKSMMYDLGVKSIVEKMLPIIDNFERGLATVSDKEKESGFVQGIELIYKQLMTTLDDIGVKPIDAVGKEFDPNFHNAVMHGEDENFGENIVAEEFQKGYVYRDLVVRHSMVKVVN